MKTFAVGPVPGEPIDLSPLHPSVHGGFQIHVEEVNGAIASARVEIGFVHRSAEKLFEVRDYRQGPMLANRHVWTSPTAGEYAYVLAAEELLGIIVSRRADLLRLIYCEIDRVLSHLAFLAPIFVNGGISAPREALADFMASVTGSRMHHQVIRIGGVAQDLDQSAKKHLTTLLTQVIKEVDLIRAQDLPGRGRGILEVEVIDSYGITGPIARASGVPRDQRMAGYGAYADFVPITRSFGDIASRFEMLLDEVMQSIALINRALNEDGVGDLQVRTPKNLRVPQGESRVSVEGALGSNGVDLFSTGGLAPDRLRVRSASFANLQALESALVGLAVNDLALFLASWPVLAGDADR